MIAPQHLSLQAPRGRLCIYATQIRHPALSRGWTTEPGRLGNASLSLLWQGTQSSYLWPTTNPQLIPSAGNHPQPVDLRPELSLPASSVFLCSFFLYTSNIHIFTCQLYFIKAWEKIKFKKRSNGDWHTLALALCWQQREVARHPCLGQQAAPQRPSERGGAQLPWCWGWGGETLVMCHADGIQNFITQHIWPSPTTETALN